MKPVFALARVYWASLFGGGERTPRAMLKMVGIGLVMLLASANVIAMFVLWAVASYDAARAVGQAGRMLANAVLTASILSLLTEVLTVLSAYFISGMEARFLSMPFKPRQLLGGKFLLLWITGIPLAALVLVPAFAVWAINEQASVLFYIFAVITLVSVPAIPLSIACLVVIPLIRAGGFLRNKNLLLGIVTTAAVFLLLALNLMFQSLITSTGSAAAMSGAVQQGSLGLSNATVWFPPAHLLGVALAQPFSLQGIAGLLGGVLLEIAFSAFVVIVLARWYVESLPGFLETHMDTLKNAASFIATHARQRRLLYTLVWREFVSMNRESSFFVNGPLIIFLLPVILGVTFIIQGKVISDALHGVLVNPDAHAWLPFAAAGLGMFFASTNQIAGTAFSREGRSMLMLRSLPFDIGLLVQAKLVHACVFNALAVAVGVSAGIWQLQLGVGDSIMAYIAAFSIATMLSAFGLLVDSFRPRLNWDNPQMALKQNPNTIISMMGGWGLIGVIIVGCAVTGNPRIAVWIALAIGILGSAALLPLAIQSVRKRYALWVI